MQSRIRSMRRARGPVITFARVARWPLTWGTGRTKFMPPNPFCDASLASISSLKDRAMIDLHYWTTPNGHKITIFLEETGLKYKIFPVLIATGAKFNTEQLA